MLIAMNLYAVGFLGRTDGVFALGDYATLDSEGVALALGRDATKASISLAYQPTALSEMRTRFGNLFAASSA
jgi:hypothetical protein